jgi:Hypoxanthine-guanine phosphoribosyltransferase
METIQVHDKVFKPYITENQIQQRIKELAENINRDYAEQTVIFIAILNGSFMFASDFFKHLTIKSEISFIKLASYKGLKIIRYGNHRYRP